MRLRHLLVILIAFTACSHATQTSQSVQSGESASSAAATSTPAFTNPIAFPLFAGSTIVTSRPWTQTVNRGSATSTSVFGAGSGVYTGHEVIAQSSATMTQVRAWLAQLGLKPPTGFHVAVGGGAMNEARARAQAMGLDFNTFEQTVNGKRHAVVVMAIDPQQLDKEAGPVVGAIGKYRMLPQMLRSTLDAQAQKRTGFTISEALDPNSPIGAALGALDQLRASGDRGIILLDATKN